MAQTISTFSKRIPPGTAGAGTLQALMERQQQAARQKEAAGAMPGPITSPWQGAAHIGNIVAAGINEGRANKQQDEARQALAQIVAGVDPNVGASKEQLAEMEYIDPVLAKQYRDEAFEARRSADERKQAILMQDDAQAATHAEGEATRDVTRSEGAATRAVTTRAQDIGHSEFQVSAAEIKRANLAGENGAKAQREEAHRAALAAEGNADATLNEQSIHNRAMEGQGQQQIDISARPDTANLPAEVAAREAEAKRMGLKPGTPEWEHFTLTGDIPGPAASTNIYNTGDQPEFDKTSDKLAAERLGNVVQEGADSVPFLANMRIISDLGKSIGTGKWAQAWAAAGPYIEMLGVDVEGMGELQSYQALVDKMAPNMRVAGAGASSDFDARQFLNSLPKLGNDPVGNQIINDTFEALGAHKQAAAEIAAMAQRREIKWTEAEAKIRALPDPYKKFKELQAAGARAPAPAGGGGGGLQVQEIEVP